MVKFLDNNSGFNQWNANKNAEKRKSPLRSMLWWFVIFVAAWWAVGLFISPKNEKTDVAGSVADSVDISAVPSSVISGDEITARVQGLRISDIKLSGVPADNGTDIVTLLPNSGGFAEIGLLSSGTPAPTAATVWQEKNGAYRWRNSDGVDFTRRVSVDGYLITISDEIKNNTKRDVAFTPYSRIVRENNIKSSAGVKTGAIAYVNGDVEYNDWRDMDKKSYAYSTTNGFAGFADQYWETIVSIARPDQTIRVKKNSDKYQADVSAGAVIVAPGASEIIETNIFAGPRDQKILGTAAEKIAGADSTIDYGWFWFLARPMLWALNGINAVVMNYGVAIIILTILLRLLMWPLTRKSYTSMIAMQEMQPEMARIQKLYANDKAHLQMEMMRLYQTHKTSPMSGCLPMLIQIPIFFALYKALLVSVQMRSAHFLWISDLAAMDPYFILPILMGATMWLQSYLQSGTQKSGANKNDPLAQTQKVMKWMPVLFTIMFAWMPAGLVLYWTVSSAFGILQMYLIKYREKK